MPILWYRKTSHGLIIDLLSYDSNTQGKIMTLIATYFFFATIGLWAATVSDF